MDGHAKRTGLPILADPKSYNMALVARRMQFDDTKRDGKPSYVRTNSVTQRSAAPSTRRTTKRFLFGCAKRDA